MRTRRQRQPLPLGTGQIEKFSHDGRGIARIEGKTTFIEGALPDETVTFQYTRQKKDFDEGRLVSVLEPSKYRVEPRCAHYSLCGGCSLQHLDEQFQIHEKQIQLLDLLTRIAHIQPDQVFAPLTSNPWHYRNKGRLSVRFVEKKNATLIGFREKHNPRYITEINNCSILNASIDAQLMNMRHLLDGFDNPYSIAQIEFAAGDEEVALIFRNLAELSAQDEERIRQFSENSGFRIFLQPGGPDSVYLLHPKDAGEFLSYSLPAENISFQFHPTDFTQINAGLNQRMVSLALELLQLESIDTVLDLFCGLGNFSLPMAKYCHNVLGIEGSDAMVNRARMNATMNGITNTEFLCANLEDESFVNSIANHQFSKVLVDPPRAGALAIVKQMDRINPQRIVYVSCNPATLARDADILVNEKGYRLVKAGVMDMFPHTAHVESIALFEKG